MLIERFFFARFNVELERALPTFSAQTRQILSLFREHRAEVYGPLPDQTRPLTIDTCQDDFTVLFLTTEIGDWYDGTFMPLIKYKLQLKLSDKPEATVPFGENVTAIGASLSLGGDEPFARPSERTMKRFREMAVKPVGGSRQWTLEDVQTLVGIIGCVAPFVGRKGHAGTRNRANMLLRRQNGVPVNIRFLSKVFISELQAFFAECEADVFSLLTRNPRGFHAGQRFCAADARAAAECAVTGWGFNVGRFYAAGGWSAKLRACLHNLTLSINALEMLVALLVAE